MKGANESALGGVTGWWHRARTFLAEVRNELRRVTWPSRKEVYATTFVVILTSIFFDSPGLSLTSYSLSVAETMSLGSPTETVCISAGQCPRPPPG